MTYSLLLKWFFFLNLLILFQSINAARILAYFSAASISHQIVFRPLTQELAKRGHEVVVITTDPALSKGETLDNLTEIDIHNKSYELMAKHLATTSRGDKNSFIYDIDQTIRLYADMIDEQLNIDEVKNAIYGKRYDLLILEATKRALLALSHVHKVPVIMVSSHGAVFGVAEEFGIPTHPMLYPAPIRRRTYNLTFWEKINEIYGHYQVSQVLQSLEQSENEMLRKHFGNDLPPIRELYSNIDLLYLNIHPVFEGNHPIPPGVVNIWGLNKKPRALMNKELRKFIDESKYGVIYMSFGTNTDPSSLPSEKIQIFLKVFCQLPYNVLWKWNKDELAGRCKNIRTEKWFPQQDLLNHPNIRVFVTQGGLQSTGEAITAGVPLVGIPMRYDQWYNVEKYVNHGIGVQLDLDTLTEEKFEDALMMVINDGSYRQNIKKLDALMSDEPMGALDRAVWWVEYVLRHGGARHLRAPAHNISWWQYLEIDLVLTIVFRFLIIVVSLIIIIRILLKSFNQRPNLQSIQQIKRKEVVKTKWRK